MQQFYEDLKPKQDGDKKGRKPGNYKWYEIQDNVAYFGDFSKEKIMWLELTDVPKFAYDNKQFFVEATAFIMTGNNLKFLSAFLNSKLSEWYFDKITTTSGVGTNRWKKVYIEFFPIPKLDSDEKKKFEFVVDKLLQTTDSLTEKLLQDQIDEMVLNIYPFSEEEKQVIFDFATKKVVSSD